MIRHIEFIIEYDLTCVGEKEDFKLDTEEYIKQDTEQYICEYTDDILENLKIKKVWYEED